MGTALLFADGEPAEHSPTEWHTSFRLPTTPGQNRTVALSRSLNSRPQPIDALWGTVGPDNVSIGRLPDGDPSSSESITTSTPGASNLTGPVVEIISVSISTQGQPTFVWTARSGQSYRIEYKNDLNAPSWINASSVIATADTASFVDTAAIGVARRFYRVVLQ